MPCKPLFVFGIEPFVLYLCSSIKHLYYMVFNNDDNLDYRAQVNAFSFASEKAERREKIGAIFFLSIFTTCVFFLVLYFVALARFDDTPLVEKAPIKNELRAVIKEDPELKTVRRVYEEREVFIPSMNSKIDRKDYYTESTSLSKILYDLKIEYLSLEDTEKDTLYYSRLKYIIQENEYHNPFDALEDSQRRDFEILRYRIGDDYDMVQDDVLKIAKELENKNQLVSQYLNKSNTSYNISIWALIITCCLSIFQIFQGFRTSKKLKGYYNEMINQCQQSGRSKE